MSRRCKGLCCTSISTSTSTSASTSYSSGEDDFHAWEARARHRHVTRLRMPRTKSVITSAGISTIGDPSSYDFTTLGLHHRPRTSIVILEERDSATSSRKLPHSPVHLQFCTSHLRVFSSPLPRYLRVPYENSVLPSTEYIPPDTPANPSHSQQPPPNADRLPSPLIPQAQGPPNPLYVPPALPAFPLLSYPSSFMIIAYLTLLTATTAAQLKSNYNHRT